MLRLRSAAFTIKDVAYTFMPLIFGLVNGLPDRPLRHDHHHQRQLLLVVFVTDNTRRRLPDPGHAPDRSSMRTPTRRSPRRVLEQTPRVKVKSIVIDEIDFVRETTSSRSPTRRPGRLGPRQRQADASPTAG